MSLVLRVIAEVITVLFLMGLAGTAIVLVMTFWEDLMTIVGVEERRQREQKATLVPNATRTSAAQ